MTPEAYWINRREDVIGMDVLREGRAARQADTYRLIARLICRFDVRSVLDVGCNVAALALFILREGCMLDYTGVDSNPYAIQKVKNVPNVMVGNLRHLSYRDQSFEAVVVKDVIEHLESYHPLAEAFRVASRYVMVATHLPFHDAPAVIQQHPDGYYTNTYRYADVDQLAEVWGFECIQDHEVFEANGSKNAVYVWRRK